MDKYRNDHRIVIIAASNKKNILDSALLSRLERAEVALPDKVTCAEIFRYYLKSHAQDLEAQIYEYAQKSHKAAFGGRNIQNAVEKAIWNKRQRGLERIDESFLDRQIDLEDKANREEVSAREKEEHEKEIQRKLTKLQLNHAEYELAQRELHEELLLAQKRSSDGEPGRNRLNVIMGLANIGISFASLVLGNKTDSKPESTKK